MCIDILLNPFLSFLKEKTGIIVPESNLRTVRAWVTERLEHLGLTAEEYIQLLKQDQGEGQLFINNTTINETYFFREEKQFLVLKRKILTRIHPRLNRVFIWSATCSSGEEAYSLAMLGEELVKKGLLMDYTVIATDIDSERLSLLPAGRYRKNSFRRDGQSFYYLLDLYAENKGEEYVIKEDVRRKVRTLHLNLLSDTLGLIPDPIFVVLFRNTIIYLNEEARRMIIGRIVKKIMPGGYLFTSSTEVPFVKNSGLELCEENGVYYFKKGGGIF